MHVLYLNVCVYYNRLVSLLPVLHSVVDVLFCLNVVGSLVASIPLFSLVLKVVPIPEGVVVDSAVLGSGEVLDSSTVIGSKEVLDSGALLDCGEVLDSVVVHFPSEVEKLLVIEFSKEFWSHSCNANLGTVITSSPTIVTLEDFNRVLSLYPTFSLGGLFELFVSQQLYSKVHTLPAISKACNTSFKCIPGQRFPCELLVPVEFIVLPELLAHSREISVDQ